MQPQLRFSLLLSLFLLVACSAFAQGGRRSPEEIAEWITQKQHEKVGFTDSQRVKVFAVNLDAATRAQELRAANGGGARGQNFKAMQEINRERDEKIMALLTDEQKPKYEAAKEELKAMMRERMQQRRGQRGGGSIGGGF